MNESYGVREQTRADSELEGQVEEVRLRGYTVLHGVLPEESLDATRKLLDRAHQAQIAESGVDALQKVSDLNIVRSLLAYELHFLECAREPRVLDVARALLGEFIVLQQQNGVVNPSGGANYQTRWHRDLPYQHFTSSRPLAVSALWCVDPFTESTGATTVLVGSHRFETFPSAKYVDAYQEQLQAAAGDVLVFDSMLFHRAGKNTSGSPRRGLNHVYSLPFIAQQISLPRAMPLDFRPDDELRRLLGYETEPAASAVEWRKTRLARAQMTAPDSSRRATPKPP